MDNDQISRESFDVAVAGIKFGGRITGRALLKILKWAVEKGKNKIQQAKEDKHGKQSIKKLLRKDQGVTSVDISKTEARDFQKVARKYGVDFAVVKHVNENPPVYTIFFKAKDQDAITDVIRAYSEKKIMKSEKQSVLKKLHKLKEKVASIPRKTIHRAKEKVR